ncbi:MAG: T9SS type A sorting domain-containing protein [Bacteroidales bacterium]|nr:T9SS type A sorting domain-containing protein [Bacteroidales bacterium]
MKDKTFFSSTVGKTRWLLMFLLMLAFTGKTNATSLELPFFENFSSGGFEQNNWTPDSENWRVTWQNGNDYPCAEFNWSPIIYNGSTTLISPLLSASAFDFGNIMLELDIKLTDRLESGTEHLFIEVSDGDNWVVLQEYTNQGSFEWQTLKFNISDWTIGREFAIRFRAAGENSGKIVSWFFDNIHVYRNCDPPEDVFLQHMVQGMYVTFSTPSSLLPVAEWVYQGHDGNFSGIGLTDGGDFKVAARWDSTMLHYYRNTSITKMRIFLREDGYTSIVLKLWRLDGSDTLLLNHLLPTPLPGEWIEVVLDTPIPIDERYELWAGYDINGQTEGTFPAGTDSGPALTGYGDLISIDGGITWDALSEIAPSLSYNWNIQLFMDDFGYVQPPSAFRYNIYRSLDQDPYEYFSNVEHMPNQYEYTFFDDLEGIPWTTLFCYKVTCVWDNGVDLCESEPGLDLFLQDEFVCIYYPVNTDEIQVTNNIYPNPARDVLHISHQEGIKEVEVFSMLGKEVLKQRFDKSNEIVMNVSGLASGMYHLRISTGMKIYVAKVIVEN